MSETPENSAQEEAQPQEGQESNAEAEGKTFDADYVEKLRKEAARYRTEAKANAEAAQRLADLEQAQMTEAEKVAKRLAEAESEVATVPTKVTDALRAHLVDIHEITDEDAELFLTATSPDLLLKQVARLVETKGAGRKQNTVPREGTNPPPADDKDATARAFFGIT